MKKYCSRASVRSRCVQNISECLFRRDGLYHLTAKLPTCSDVFVECFFVFGVIVFLGNSLN